jgi:ribosomal protein S18 acetylase RimI-like enzyme
MEFTIRRAVLEDGQVIVAHRRAMFWDMGRRDLAALDAMSARFEPWLLAKMRAGEYLAWFAASAGGEIAAGLGLWLMDWPPHLVGSGPRRGNIVNVYTNPESRRNGLARSLVRAALDWCRDNGVDCVILHASEEGRGLYEGLGFRATNEMRILLTDVRMPT